MFDLFLGQAMLAGLVVLGSLSFRRRPWAFLALIALSIVWFPIRGQFYFDPRPCELTFDRDLAIYSLFNFTHIVIATMFFLMAVAQQSGSRLRTLLIAAVVTVAMGVVVEVSEDVWGGGNCRTRDLIPVVEGVVVGAAVVWMRRRVQHVD